MKTVNAKGEVVIPKEMRVALGIQNKSRVTIKQQDNSIIITPIKQEGIERWSQLADEKKITWATQYMSQL